MNTLCFLKRNGSRCNDYTTQVLFRLGFAWSPTSWDYVERMLTAIGGFGFFCIQKLIKHA